MQATGFVTAGGRSSRMGRDKAWLELGGLTMIERVIGALRPVAQSISIIANRGEYARLGLPVLRDERQGVGPLEAIRTALANSPAPYAILAGCDLPFVTAELFAFLLALAPNHQAVIPVSSDGRLEPLCAVYAASALDTITRLIDQGHRKVSLLFERIDTRFVSAEEMSHLAGAPLFFENVNTPADYERAAALLDGARL